MKEDTRVEGPWTYGEEPQQGRRTDLEAVKDDLDQGMQDSEVADKHFSAWCRYRQSFKEYRLLRASKRNWQTTVTVYWGPSGTGKTRRAAYEAGPDAYWLNNTGGNVLWWDGYTGQDTVVIDEFYGWIKYSDMLRIVDRYPYAVQVTYPDPFKCVMNTSLVLNGLIIGLISQVRGASVNFIAKHIIITSNTHPNAWWQQGLRAMERRLDEPIGSVTEMLTGVWEPPVSSVPLPPSSMPCPSQMEREETPQMMMIDSGSSMRPVISCGSSAAAPSCSGGAAGLRVDVTRSVSALMSLPESPTMESGLTPSRAFSPPFAPWQMTRQWRTPSPPPQRSHTEWSWAEDNIY